MDELWLYILGSLVVGSLTALAVVGYRLKTSLNRVNRSLDPILQKSKTLKIELSALQQSRNARQRRLESTAPKDSNSDK